MNDTKQGAYLTIKEVARRLGLSRQAIQYRIANNFNDILDYSILVRLARDDKKKPNKNARRRYFIHESFIREVKQSKKINKEEKENFESLYYYILEYMEDRLTLEEKSIATEQQKWLNMTILDIEIFADICYVIEEEKKYKLTKRNKAEIREYIHAFRFSSTSREIFDMTIKSMEEIKQKMEVNKW